MSTSYSKTLLADYSVLTLDSMTESAITSNITNLLEFEDELMIADLKSTAEFYNGLLESGFILNENVLDSIADFLSKAIYAIESFFTYVFKNSAGIRRNGKFIYYENKINHILNMLAKLSTEFEKQYKDNKFHSNRSTIKIYERPSNYGCPIIADVIGDIANLEYTIGKLDKLLVKLADKNTSAKEIENDIEELIDLEKDAMSEINSYDIYSNFKTSKVEVDSGDYVHERLSNLKEYNEFKDGKKQRTIDTYPQLKKMIDIMHSFKRVSYSYTSDEKSMITKLKKLISIHAALVKHIINKFNSYCSLMYSTIADELSIILNMAQELLSNGNDESGGGDVKHETAIELAIQNEIANYRWERMEIYKEAIIQEASILSNPELDTIYEMQLLNEATNNKTLESFNKMIAKLKEIFKIFMERLLSASGATKSYMDKYKKIILEGNVPDHEYRGSDLIRGMNAIMQYQIDGFNYNNLKDRLADNATLFEFITRNAPHSNFKASVTIKEGTDSTTNISTWFKEYFGMSDDTRISAKIIKDNLKSIYDFMYEVRPIERSIERSIKSIDKMKDDVLRQIGLNNSANTIEKDNNAQSINNESYYSYIDNIDYFLEAIKANNPENTSNTVTPNKTTPITNVRAMVDNKGKVQYSTNGANVAEVSKACDVYIAVVSSALKAKLTAVEVLRKDFMYIYRRMVDSVIKSST